MQPAPPKKESASGKDSPFNNSENSDPDIDQCTEKISNVDSESRIQSGNKVDPSILSQKNHHALVKELRDQNIQLNVVNKKATDFYFLKILGEGSFSTVYLAEDINTTGKYALKIMSKDLIKKEKKMVQVLREKDIVASLTYAFGGHPLVIKLFCTFQDSRRLYFVFNHAKNGELYDILRHLGKLSEEMALFYTTEIVEALFFIHNCRIVHRDLKPENILLGHDWHIIISDFGSAKMIGNEEQEKLESKEAAELRAQGKARGSFVGTAQYISPEVLQSQLAGYEADFWAVGAILYQMLTGQVPFRANNEYHIMKRVMNLQYEFPEGLPENAKDLISKILVIEPEKRLGSLNMGGQEAIKSHPYFNKIDWSSVPSRTPPNFIDKLPKNWRLEHDIPLSSNKMKPGLCEDSVNRMMGFGKYAAEPEPEPLSKDQLDELKLAAQRDENIFHKFVKDNLIIKFGFIDKKKGLFARRRMFLLTEGPHLFYVDPVNMELRGEVPFTKDLRVEAKNFRAFFIHVPGRTYILFDPERNAKKWCDAIEEVKQRYFGNSIDDPQPSSSTKDSKKFKKKEDKKDKKK